jgi:actin-related protein 5
VFAPPAERDLTTRRKEPPTFPLIDVPDDKLTEDEIKDKRRQKLMKAGYDARIRARAEKEAEKLRKEAEEREAEAFRIEHPEQWLADLREQYEVRF